MVTALGIDVRKAFTLVFALGGAVVALAGVLSGVYYGVVDPTRGTSLLIFAFIVVVIGGFGSIGGTAVAAVAVGLIQQYANYYASSGLGDLAVVLLLALVLLREARGAGAEGGALTRVRPFLVPAVLFAVFALIPTLSLDIPVLLGGPLDSPGTLRPARALPRLRRRRAHATTSSSASRACSRSATRSTSRSAST